MFVCLLTKVGCSVSFFSVRYDRNAITLHRSLASASKLFSQAVGVAQSIPTLLELVSPIHHPQSREVWPLRIDILFEDPGHIAFLLNVVVDLCTALDEVCFHGSIVGSEAGQGNGYLPRAN